MTRIAKRYEFSASHQLTGLSEGHACMRLHGHSYGVEFELLGPVNANGFLIDYREIDALVKPFVDAYLDHRHLNDFIPQPTAENLAEKLFRSFRDVIPYLHAVTVSETPKTWARYEHEPRG